MAINIYSHIADSLNFLPDFFHSMYFYRCYDLRLLTTSPFAFETHLAADSLVARRHTAGALLLFTYLLFRTHIY